MQRERSALNSFPETFDLNSNAMDHSASWDNTITPVENRLSNYMLTPRDANPGCTHAPSNCIGGWDRGESSSSANNTKEKACSDESDMRLDWSSSFNACSSSDGRSEDWSFQPSNVSSSSYLGNQVTGRSQNYSSSHGSLDLSSNYGHLGLGIGLPHTLYKSGQPETGSTRNFYASSSNIGASGSSNSLLENNDASGPSMGTWGSSCKRKALDGNSGQFYAGGSSSSNQPVENILPHNVPGCYSVSENLSMSSGLLNLSPPNHLEQMSPRNGAGMSRVAPTFFPASSVPGIPETSARDLAIRSSLGHREPVPYDSSRGTSLRHTGVYGTPQLSRRISNIDSSTMNTQMNQPHFMHLNETRGMNSHHWSGSFSSRGGSSSSFGERGSGTHEEATVRSSIRNNFEYPAIVSAPETRNILQDQIDWSFAPGTSASSSRNHQSSAPRIGQSSGGPRGSSVTWLPHQNQPPQSHQRVSEAAPWIPFPRMESDSGTRRSQLAFLPSGSSSSDEAASSSRVRQQSDHRSAAFLMDMGSDDVHGWRTLSAVEGRHRLIRQVLSAMRRGVHLQAEDYVLIDPFVNGFAELHDRHRDMRLDVDNMSYEELLALEERIGNVSTGLSEEKIWASLKQRTYEAVQSSPNLEPCCICQEDYIAGDELGILDCGHEFHTNCIKQWLIVKNLCPICKMTALGT